MKLSNVAYPMERVGILINKLQEQLEQQADIKNMLITAQMLQAELLQKSSRQNGHFLSKVSVMMPVNFNVQQNPMPVEEFLKPFESETKPVEATEPIVSKEPEITIEYQPSGFNRGGSASWMFDPNEVPTLAHQEKAVYELNDTMLSEVGSLNESLKEEKPEVASILQDIPIRDLKKAISINDRHLFIHDLFRGDETMYERSIKTINSFNIFAEAEYWIQRELKLKLGWDLNNKTVQSFDQLVKRRFS